MTPLLPLSDPETPSAPVGTLSPGPAETAAGGREGDEAVRIDPARARRLAEVGIGILLDVREDWERELEGDCPGAEPFPLLSVRAALGLPLSAAEREALDAPPEAAAARGREAISRLTALLRREESPLLFCLCNRGERSRAAARLIRAQGWGEAWSVEGGVRALAAPEPASPRRAPSA